MIILAIDTSMGASSAAVLVRAGGETRLFAPPAVSGRDQAEGLIPLIESALADAGLGFADLTHLAVTVGPGSFSGVRTGLAAVKGFSLALGLPVFAASSLEVMAYGFRRTHSGAVVIAAPAGRDQMFCQSFSADGVALNEPLALVPADAAGEIPVDITIAAGPAAAHLADAALQQGRELTAVLPELVPSAALLAEMAASMPATDGLPLRPLYLRPPDAKPQQSKILPHAEAARRL